MTRGIKLRLESGNLFTVVFGLCFVAAGAYIYLHMGRYLETVQQTSAVVVQVVHESEGTRKGRLHPVVRFKTKDGKEVTGKSQRHLNVQPGDALQIMYDPRHPEEIEVGTLAAESRRRIFFSGLCVLIGAFICAMGIAMDTGLLKRGSTAS